MKSRAMSAKFSFLLLFTVLTSLTQFPLHLIRAQTPQTLVPVQSEKANSMRIAIWVYNYPRISDRTLAESEEEVDRIFAKAGISDEWIQCPTSAEEVRSHPVCQEGMTESDLALTILPRIQPPTHGRTDSYFGSAQVFTNGQFGHYAYVYYDRVEDPANRGGSSVSQVLADVAAHELGHLLLRSIAHAPAGLMRAQWQQDDLQRGTMGQLLFSPAETGRIRAEVRARVEAAARRNASASFEIAPQTKKQVGATP